MNRQIALKKTGLFDIDLILFLLNFVLLLMLILKIPELFISLRDHIFVISVLSCIGLYRSGLWMAHFIRAQIYEKFTYPEIRKKADSLKDHQWKPERLYFMIVSYGEDRKVLYNSIKSIIHEARNLNLPATICMGTASRHDENIVADAVNTLPYGERIKVIFTRQNRPDKRSQIGCALRALVRQGMRYNDPVIFMDGDSIIMPGCLRKCLPIFKTEPRVQSITTNERAIVTNSSLMSDLMNLRFAIRNFHMNSLACSRKVLCLTGRFSVFRAGAVSSEEFISRIEKDYIDDWYWNRIYFVTGDDKSTWYTLLKNGAEMLYIPDAFIYCIEKVRTNPVKDYMENLKRWGGNMLRNNSRAQALGLKKLNFFPWLVLLDQKYNMWTAIISPTIIILSLFQSIRLTYMIILWILLVKHLQSIVVFYYGKKVNCTYPALYYFHQLLNGMVKIYMLFHLRLQRWNNRNNGGVETISIKEKFHFIFAKYITGLYLVIFLILINLLVNFPG